MRGGGSWLPLFWLMLAFLIVVKSVDLLRPFAKRKLRQWRERSLQHTGHKSDFPRDGFQKPE